MLIVVASRETILANCSAQGLTSLLSSPSPVTLPISDMHSPEFRLRQRRAGSMGSSGGGRTYAAYGSTGTDSIQQPPPPPLRRHTVVKNAGSASASPLALENGVPGPSLLIGSELVNWAIATGKAISREEGCRVFQKALDFNYLMHVDTQAFVDEFFSTSSTISRSSSSVSLQDVSLDDEEEDYPIDGIDFKQTERRPTLGGMPSNDSGGFKTGGAQLYLSGHKSFADDPAQFYVLMVAVR